MLRENWSSSTMSARQRRASSFQPARAPAAACSCSAMKCARISASKASSFANQCLRRSPEVSPLPNQNRKTSPARGSPAGRLFSVSVKLAFDQFFDALHYVRRQLGHNFEGLHVLGDLLDARCTGDD